MFVPTSLCRPFLLLCLLVPFSVVAEPLDTPEDWVAIHKEPSEKECRSYIERALKEQRTQPDEASLKEDVSAASIDHSVESVGGETSGDDSAISGESHILHDAVPDSLEDSSPIETLPKAEDSEITESTETGGAESVESKVEDAATDDKSVESESTLESETKQSDAQSGEESSKEVKGEAKEDSAEGAEKLASDENDSVEGGSEETGSLEMPVEEASESGEATGSSETEKEGEKTEDAASGEDQSGEQIISEEVAGGIDESTEVEASASLENEVVDDSQEVDVQLKVAENILDEVGSGELILEAADLKTEEESKEVEEHQESVEIEASSSEVGEGSPSADESADAASSGEEKEGNTAEAEATHQEQDGSAEEKDTASGEKEETASVESEETVSTETVEVTSAETVDTSSAEVISTETTEATSAETEVTSAENEDTASVEGDAASSEKDTTASAEDTTSQETSTSEKVSAAESKSEEATPETEKAQAKSTDTVEESSSEDGQSGEEAGTPIKKSQEVEGEETSSEAGSSEPSTEQASPEEEDLIMKREIPDTLRQKSHITEILRLDGGSLELVNSIAKIEEATLKELKRVYETAIKPLEILYKYRDLSNRHFGDAEIFSKPLILFMGPWSGGKSTIINYLLDNEFKKTALRTGAEPSPAYFNIVMSGENVEILDGTQLAADWTFSGLQKFGQGLLDRLRGLRMNHPLLDKVNIVEIPGILEIRKQVERLFPFNDACQWFIDRADIIFLVYDPSKLDVGPETEAILDQLKGREYQTRIILNKADQVKPEELMRVQGTLIWNISPLMSSTEPPVMYSTSLWSLPYEMGSPTRLLFAQEKAFLKDLKDAIEKRVDNKIASARRFAVRVRNHAKMVDCYLTTYYNHKSFFGNKQKVAEDIIDNPQNYHIYEGLSTLTNISRYDLPDPEVYKDFFRLNAVYDFQQLASTCTYFRGCPINRLDVAIAYDLPELLGKFKKQYTEVIKKYSSAAQKP